MLNCNYSFKTKLSIQLDVTIVFEFQISSKDQLVQLLLKNCGLY